ncbi:MAG: type II secretion system F family protein [Anaerolineales bacterium]|nr:type II secretion system F family protein [Anaerolineales bacterium]
MGIVIVVVGVILIVLLVIGIIVSTNSENAMVEQRLDQYFESDSQVDKDKQVQRAVLTEWVSKRVEKTTFGDRVARELARADLKFKVSEYFALILIAIVGLGGIAWLVGNRNIISFFIGAGIGMFLPRFYVKQQQAARLRKFNDQLSDMLNLTVNGLRAGYSVMQAMESVGRELPPPICDEFRRVVQEMQIGITMENALENLLRRIPSEDLDFVITSINVQREVGGNLSEILDTISFTIRERVRIKGEIRVMTSQVRASGAILSMVPFFLTLVLWFINPEYLLSVTQGGPLCAGIIICVVLGLIGSGYAVMMKIADIEV